MKLWAIISYLYDISAKTARLMIGVPDYDNYVRHMRRCHPHQQPLSYAEFFKQRQEARYGAKGGSSRCC